MDECLFEGLKKLGGHLALGPHTCAIVGKEGQRIYEEIEEEELKKVDTTEEAEKDKEAKKNNTNGKGGDGEEVKMDEN